ncbi:hypothetical protein GCM10027048_37070 [Hymenobacter coalescens]
MRASSSPEGCLRFLGAVSRLGFSPVNGVAVWACTAAVVISPLTSRAAAATYFLMGEEVRYASENKQGGNYADATGGKES